MLLQSKSIRVTCLRMLQIERFTRWQGHLRLFMVLEARRQKPCSDGLLKPCERNILSAHRAEFPSSRKLLHRAKLG